MKMLQRSLQKTAAGWSPSYVLLSHFFTVASVSALVFCPASLFVFSIIQVNASLLAQFLPQK